MTVYVPQQPVPTKNGWIPDLSPAIDFGKINYVFDGGERVYALPGPMMKKAQNILKDFDPKNDYILWTNSGDPAALWTCCFALCLLGFSSVKILYWNRKRVTGERIKNEGFYTPINYDLKKMIN